MPYRHTQTAHHTLLLHCSNSDSRERLVHQLLFNSCSMPAEWGSYGFCSFDSDVFGTFEWQGLQVDLCPANTQKISIIAAGDDSEEFLKANSRALDWVYLSLWVRIISMGTWADQEERREIIFTNGRSISTLLMSPVCKSIPLVILLPA